MKRPRDEVVYPKRGKDDPTMGPMAIMVAMEEDLAAIRRFLGIDGRRAWKTLSSRVYMGVGAHQDMALVGPMCGAPYAVMVLEKLIALGVKRMLFFGWCGSIQQDLPVGRVLVPDRAISEEGTSAHYPVSSPQPRPSDRVLRAIEESLVESSVPFQRGAVWTTDAPYRETREKVVLFQGQGVLGVEMEVSALFTVAAFRQIDMGALLMVSDDLSSLRWKPGFSSSAFKEARSTAIPVLPAICGKMTDFKARRMGL
ncbi:MAG: nucleoside phosphorylase [Thermodesulfobacteriota bacterium]|nr:nucleoside phosphorylase [Thermodesulfobacteriota bacterium]